MTTFPSPLPTHFAIHLVIKSQASQKPLKMSKEYTYQDVAEHNTKKDLFVVIHDNIYDASKFLDEHP